MRVPLFIGFALLAFACITSAQLIGIDFGSEFVKVALVAPGKSVEIVLDEQAARKIPQCVAFDDNQRFFGNGATGLLVRRPQHTFMYAQPLLGRALDSPQVQLIKECYYPFDLVELPDRQGAVGYRAPSNLKVTLEEESADDESSAAPVQDVVYSPEEMVAMTLQHIKRISETVAGLPVRDCVITVPEFFTQKQRQAMLDAADIAGFNVLSLLNENTGAAIQYGLDRQYKLNESHVAVFYNMGATSTKVTLANFTAYPGKKDKPIGQVEIQAVAFDETLGGNAFEARITKHLLEKFIAQLRNKGDQTDVTSNHRVMAKLRLAASKAKVVLSANKETQVYVGSLLGDEDFSCHLTRETFLSLSHDLVARVTAPLASVMAAKGLKPADVDAVVIIGGGVRVPAVQQAITEFLEGKELAQNLNGDEAMATGAAFRAANLSTAFKVRPLGLVDLSPFAVGVTITDLASSASSTGDSQVADVEAPASEEAASQAEDSQEDLDTPATTSTTTSAYSKHATLFRRHHRLAKRKTVALTLAEDMRATLQYESKEALPKGVSTLIAAYNISGLSSAAEGANPAVKPEVAKLLQTQKPKVSLSFVLDGSGLTELFKAEATLEQLVQVPKAPAAEKKEKEGEKEQEKKDEAAETETEAEGEEKKEEFDVKKVIHRIPLEIKRDSEGEVAVSLSPVQIKAARKRLARLQKADDFRKQIGEAKNDLESFIYRARTKMEESEVESVSNEDQRTAVSEALAAAEDWLFEQADDGAKKFRAKLAEIKGLAEPIFERASELSARPQAINSTEVMIGYTRELIGKWEKERAWMKKEIDELKDMVDKVESFLAEKVAEQAAKLAHEVPAFTSAHLLDKLRAVGKYTSSLMKRKKPMEPAYKPKDKAAKDKTAKTKEAETEQKPAEEQPEQQQQQQQEQEQQQQQQPSEPEQQQQEAAEAESNKINKDEL